MELENSAAFWRNALDMLRYNSLERYHPYPKQAEFHRNGVDKRERLFAAANQVGKTIAGSMELAMHLTGKYPQKWEGRMWNKPVVCWAAGITGESTRDSVQKMLIGRPGSQGTGSIPRDDILEVTASRGVANLADTILVQHISGGVSQCVLKTYEKGREKWQAETLDCIAEGQRILFADGRYIPIESVSVGDNILTVSKSNGKKIVRTVTAVMDRGIQEVVEVETSRGPWFYATIDHNVYVGSTVMAPLSKAGMVLQIPSSYEPSVILVNLPDAYYAWLGLVISVGYFEARKITIGDEDTVRKAESLLPIEAKLRKKILPPPDVPDWFLYWPEFWALCYPGLAHEKYVPDWVFMSSNEKICTFLTYLFAGDGWASGHMIGYTSTSKLLIEQIMILLWRIGIRSSMQYKFGVCWRKQDRQCSINSVLAIGENRKQWSLSVSQAESVDRFRDIIGIIGKEDAVDKVNEEDKRRVKSLYARGGNLSDDVATIKSIRTIGNRRVYDITVEEDHRFCVGTSVVSNCVWFDEEPPYDIYTEGLTRTNATGGMVFITFTPLMGMSDVVRRFWVEESPDRAITKMDITEALHIDSEQRRRIINGYLPHEREARAYGIPVLGSGRVFPIEEAKITVDAFPIPKHWRQIGGLDFGIDHPTAAVRLCHDTDDDVVYIDACYRVRDATPLTHCERLKPWGTWLPWAWPHDGLIRDKGSGIELRNIYASHGLDMLPEKASFSDGSYGFEAGIAHMLERMQTGRLKVFSHLNDFFDEFRLYHRKDGIVVKERDDIISAVRYSVMMLRYAKSKPQPMKRRSEKGKEISAWAN